MLSEYTWVVIVGGFFCFAMGFGIGANDVSNNFGTSVGSKSITLKKAIIIAAIFELIGSVCLGAVVTDALRKGVYHPEAFGAMPDVLLMANMSALMSGTLWLLFASRFGLPVSTSHSLIGAMVGCGLVVGGFGAIKWRFMGTVLISWLASPFLSAIIGAIYFCAVRNFILRSPSGISRGFKILWLLVFIISSVFSLFFVFSNPITVDKACSMKLSNGAVVRDSPCVVSRWVALHPGWSAASAMGLATLLTLLVGPWCYYEAYKTQRQHSKSDLEDAPEVDGPQLQPTISILNSDTPPFCPGMTHMTPSCPVMPTSPVIVSPDERLPSTEDVLNIPFPLLAARSPPRIPQPGTLSSNSSTHNPCGRRSSASTVAPSDGSGEDLSTKNKVTRTWEAMPWNKDLHADAYREDQHAERLGDLAEQFDPRVEAFFTTLQIISASVACLVHGSNDVSNAAAPYASVYSIYKEGQFLTHVPVPLWILIMGGCAISIGLTFLGHRVIKRVGIKLLYISPSRGFCVEMAMATVMISASYLGLPLSTTQVAVGAMIGIGLCDRHYEQDGSGQIRKGGNFLGMNLAAINWPVVKTICFAWIGTMIVCATASAAIFGFAIYSPTLTYTRYAPRINT